MDSISKKNIWFLGACVNLTLLSKLIVRPKLWSTTNSFLGCILALNSFYLFIHIMLNVEEKKKGNNDDLLFQSLEHLYADSYMSVICSARYMSYFIHGSSTLYVMVGIIFIRSMMIKHADNIRQNNLACKSHQARLSVIGILVAVLVLTGCIGVIMCLILLPRSPFNFVLVRFCRWVPISYQDDEKRKIIGNWLSRLIFLLLIALAIFSCQLRIIIFRRRHNSSYFSHFRQNIATVDQTFAAAYLKISFSLIMEVIFFYIVNNTDTTIDLANIMNATVILDCVIIPSYWMFSTKQDFREFWSYKTVFWRNHRPEKYLSQHDINVDVHSVPLEPRPAHILETSFCEKRNKHGKADNVLKGKFSYNFGLKNI